MNAMNDDATFNAEDILMVNPYPIPLYLNQKYVFSLLAVMEGGYAQLENVTSTKSDEAGKSNKFSGEVGVTNAFAFLTAKLGGERNTETKNANSTLVVSERVYTPDSLFVRLREQLHSEGIIRTDDLVNAVPGDYVEFTATLSENPFIAGLEDMRELMGILDKNEQINSSAPKIQPSHATKQAGNGNRNKTQSQAVVTSTKKSQYAAIGEVIDLMLGNLKGAEGNTFYLLGAITDSPLRSVLVLDPNFANDPIATDLIDGQYTVLGKVVRAIPEKSKEKIKLLRNTTLGKFDIFGESIGDALASMSEHGVVPPDVKNTEIGGPVIQVVPIAIFM